MTPAEQETDYEIWQDDECVAMTNDFREAQRYMAVYSQDGAVECYKVEKTRTRVVFS